MARRDWLGGVLGLACAAQASAQCRFPPKPQPYPADEVKACAKRFLDEHPARGLGIDDRLTRILDDGIAKRRDPNLVLRDYKAAVTGTVGDAKAKTLEQERAEQLRGLSETANGTASPDAPKAAARGAPSGPPYRESALPDDVPDSGGPIKGSAAPPAAPAAAKLAAPPDPPTTLSSSAMADRFAAKYGVLPKSDGSPNALAMVINARGGETGDYPDSAEAKKARAELSALIAGEPPITSADDIRLARVDHVLNVRTAVAQVAPLDCSESLATRAVGRAKRVVQGAGGIFATLGYDGAKCVYQATGWNLGRVFGVDFKGASPCDARNTASAVAEGVTSPWACDR